MLTFRRGLLLIEVTKVIPNTSESVDEDISPRFYILSNYRAIGKTNSKQSILKQFELWHFVEIAEMN